MQGGQAGAGGGAEFEGERLAGGLVHGECLAGAARPVQGPHEQFLGALAQRVFGGEGAQGRDGRGLAVQAEFQRVVEVGLAGGQPQSGEPVAPGLGVGAGEAGQRAARPECEGALPGAVRLPDGSGGSQPGGVGEPALELVDVHRRAGQSQDVAAGGEDEDPGGCPGRAVRFEEGPQPGRVRPYGPHGTRRRALSPQRVAELGYGDGPPRPQQQYGEQRALLVRAQGQRGAVGRPRGHRPEQPEPYALGERAPALRLRHVPPRSPDRTEGKGYFAAAGTAGRGRGSGGRPSGSPPPTERGSRASASTARDTRWNWAGARRPPRPGAR